ncbi:MAG: DUF2085 domain-containing protein [Candidatus Thorarchaeota archaeon]|nr:MAG: DUF2085 domain-containing protein [Candidatus Thorarchaeota archaeon]
MEHKEWTRRDEIRESLHILVSHHPPSLFGHCLRLTFRGKSVYFCGRCSGIYGGIGLGIPILFLLDAFTQYTLFRPAWIWFLFALALGLTTVVDWVTQRLTPRKTTVRLRAISGFASGFSLAIIFILGDLFYMLVALMVMMVSVGGVSVYENRRNRIKKEKKPEEEP